MTQAQEMMNVAVQVAHDIRSPLAALAAVEQDLSMLPEESRALLKAAIGRIRGIASDLLDRTRNRPSVTAVTPLVESMVREKQLQHREVAGLEIRFEAMPGDLHAALVPMDFLRAISNLIDNAVEACDVGGLVTVSLSEMQGMIRVRISDDGMGMTAEVLRKVGKTGFSHGKTNGNGLGLSYSRGVAEAWGGRLQIDSAWGRGTTVSFDLPA